MTDISNWASLIHRKRIKKSQRELDKMARFFRDRRIDELGEEYVMIPMDDSGYQLGNLLWFLCQHPEDSTGDWYEEIKSIIVEACIREKIRPTSNMEGNDEFNSLVRLVEEHINEQR